MSAVFLHSPFVVKNEISTNSTMSHKRRTVSWRVKARYPTPRAVEAPPHFSSRDFLVASPSNQGISQYFGNAGRFQRDVRDGSLSRGMNKINVTWLVNHWRRKRSRSSGILMHIVNFCAFRAFPCISLWWMQPIVKMVFPSSFTSAL